MDRCLLKGRYRGILLSVVTIDANSKIFPIVIVIVE